MKWDFAVGNPAYQAAVDETGDNKTFSAPVYNLFLDEAFKIADKVEMIHPARFLFNAGATPKAWNEKMLNDHHFKVLEYEEDAAKVFPNTDIKGGVAITYRDEKKDFGKIEVFTKYQELNEILHKIQSSKGVQSLNSIIYNQNRFNLDALFSVFPEYRSVIGSGGQDKRFRNNIFDKIPAFTSDKKNDTDIPVIGLIKNKKCWRYISREFVDMQHENIRYWKVLLSSASGSGVLGETLSKPIIASPYEAYTQTYISIGMCGSEQEAIAIKKYVCTKFCRTLLGILKITQHITPASFKYVPIQDFTSNSDINWNTSVANIDKQLYKKYGLSQEEIDFIETHVKEMA